MNRITLEIWQEERRLLNDIVTELHPKEQMGVVSLKTPVRHGTKNRIKIVWFRESHKNRITSEIEQKERVFAIDTDSL